MLVAHAHAVARLRQRTAPRPPTKRSRQIESGLAVVGAASVAGWILFACVGHDVAALGLPEEASDNDVSSMADAGDGLDADADAGRPCTTAMPFLNVVEVGGVNTTTYEEAIPRLTSDEKTIVFTRLNEFGDDHWHLYIATRTSADADFQTPQLITELSGAWEDFDPWISASGDELLFSSDRNRSDGVHVIYRARRDNGVFGISDLLLPSWSANAKNSEGPFLSSDGNELLFSSIAASTNGAYQIYHSWNSADGFLEPPELVSGIVPSDPNAYHDDAPVLSRDGLTLYFGSDRSSAMRIYYTERAEPTASFNNIPQPVNTNLAADNETWALPGWLSDDGCRLYFESIRNGTNGTRDLFVATK
ncbi:MAG: hypothetical protein FWD73_01045 [Polyangiaceae bacterium]|nr:hypothetical protein [Polyangiaceae bacterium]